MEGCDLKKYMYGQIILYKILDLAKTHRETRLLIKGHSEEGTYAIIEKL